MRQIAHRLFAFSVAVLTAGTASAHQGHTTHSNQSDPLPLALLFSGLLVFGAGLYLATRDDVGRLYVITGIGLGLTGVAAALGLFLRHGF